MHRYGSAYIEVFQSDLLSNIQQGDRAMAIAQTINESRFIDAFQKAGRYDQMGRYDGCKALFEYLDDLSDGLDEPIELDPVGFCCDYAQYDDLDDIRTDYGLEGDDDEVKEYLLDHSILIEYEGGFIIQQF